MNDAEVVELRRSQAVLSIQLVLDLIFLPASDVIQYESLFHHVTESSPADGADRVASEKGAITRRFMTEGKIMISRPQISRFMPNFVSEIYLVVLYVLYCQC